MKVGELLREEVIVVSPDDNLAHARNLMLRYEVSRLPVVDEEGRLLGIVTKYDLSRKIADSVPSWKKRGFDRIFVAEIMTEKPVSISKETSVSEAAKIMLQKGISGLPVVDDRNRLVGIVTKADLVAYFALHHKGRYLVRDFMTKKVIVVSPLTPVSKIVSIMEEKGIHRVLVTDERGNLAGIVTASDIAFAELEARKGPAKVREIARGLKAELSLEPGGLKVVKIPSLTASDIMTTDLLVVKETEDLAKVAGKMIEHGVSSFPVLNAEGKLVGIITKTDIVRAVASLE